VAHGEGFGVVDGVATATGESLDFHRPRWIYGIGDATDIPVSKSGSAAHFEAKALADRLVGRIRGTNGHEPPVYDGHVLCFLETDHGQASQLMFDSEHPPHPPAPNHFNHDGKMLFNKVYWYIVPQGIV
jgi:sulfide:quinone oxidoreductase